MSVRQIIDQLRRAMPLNGLIQELDKAYTAEKMAERDRYSQPAKLRKDGDRIETFDPVFRDGTPVTAHL